MRGVNIVVRTDTAGASIPVPLTTSDHLEEWRNFKFGTADWSLLLKGVHILYFNIPELSEQTHCQQNSEQNVNTGGRAVIEVRG